MEDERLKRILVTIGLILVVMFAFWTIVFDMPVKIPEIFTPDSVPESTPEPIPESTPTPTNQTNDSRTTGWVDGGGRTIPSVPDVPRGVDIVVDGNEPWNTTYSGNLSSMMPGELRSIAFDISNAGVEKANIYMRMVITNESGGNARYAGIASSEPEYTDCLVNGAYVEKCDLSDNLYYGLSANTDLIVDPNNLIVLGDLDGTWLYLGQLNVDQSMIVHQTYVLGGEVSNWAQGDVMSFDMTVYAVALDGGAP